MDQPSPHSRPTTNPQIIPPPNSSTGINRKKTTFSHCFSCKLCLLTTVPLAQVPITHLPNAQTAYVDENKQSAVGSKTEALYRDSDKVYFFLVYVQRCYVHHPISFSMGTGDLYFFVFFSYGFHRGWKWSAGYVNLPMQLMSEHPESI